MPPWLQWVCVIAAFSVLVMLNAVIAFIVLAQDAPRPASSDPSHAQRTSNGDDDAAIEKGKGGKQEMPLWQQWALAIIALAMVLGAVYALASVVGHAGY